MNDDMNDDTRDPDDEVTDLSSLEQELANLGTRVNELNDGIAAARNEARKASESASNAVSAARGSSNEGTIWFVGLILAALIAMTSNPSVADHEAFIANKVGDKMKRDGLEWKTDIMKNSYQSFLIFSRIDVGGADDEGVLTFGIFGNVFEMEALKKFRSKGTEKP